MLSLLALATLALSTPAPVTVNFTTDSVYKNESIISPKDIIKQENDLYTITFEEDKLLGYCIYDVKETEYTDGFKFDDVFVTNYRIEDVDLSVEHTILLKTVYTDDVAGMLAAAKDGDWSKIMSNPLILFQTGYYSLAAISLIIGGFGLLKAKKKKVKTSEEIASSVKNEAVIASNALKEEAKSLVLQIITPLSEKLTMQNQKIIEAFILAQSGDKNSKIALIDLLKNSAIEDVSALSNSIIQAVESTDALKEKAKEEAKKLVDDIAQGSLDDKIGGLSI